MSKTMNPFKIGDKTNKGVVEAIYSIHHLSINGDLYDLRKHDVRKLKPKFNL